jgi:hypothetical protein
MNAKLIIRFINHLLVDALYLATTAISSLRYVPTHIADRLVSRVQEPALEGRKPVAPTDTLTTRNSPGVKCDSGVTLMSFDIVRHFNVGRLGACVRLACCAPQSMPSSKRRPKAKTPDA